MNWFDLVILCIVVLASIKGYISGLVKQLASLAGLIVGGIFAGYVAGFISPYILELTGVSDHIIKPLSYFFAFLGILIAFWFLGTVIQSILEFAKINTLNRLAGSLFSVLKWLILISVLLNIIVELDAKDRIIKKNIQESSFTYSYVKAITPYFIPFLDFEK